MNDWEYYENSIPLWWEDLVVPTRPHELCTWDFTGGLWVYPLDRCQETAKRIIAADIDQFINQITYGYAVSQTEGYAGCYAVAEVRYLADNPSSSDAELPLLAGYAAQMGGGATKADAAAEIDETTGPTLFGKIMSLKKTLFDQIDAAADGFDALQVLFDSDDLV
jgi:hypothetical protein